MRGLSGAFERALPAAALILLILTVYALSGYSGGSIFTLGASVSDGGADKEGEKPTLQYEIKYEKRYVLQGLTETAWEKIPDTLCFKKAEELRKKYAVTVLFGLKAQRSISGYEIGLFTDVERISECLSELSKALSEYPEGFIRALSESGVTLELTGALRSVSASNIDRPDALAEGALIAIDISRRRPLAPVLMHEISHLADARLEALSKEDESHWSSEAWAELLPAHFRYYESYVDEYGFPVSMTGDTVYTWESGGEAWFVNAYSKTYPTEDRAVMMETLIRSNGGAECLKAPRIRAKLLYYFEALRYYLDPGGDWPEPVFWEALLNKSL